MEIKTKEQQKKEDEENKYNLWMNEERIYAPADWIGKRVKLILLEPLE